jgi:hypothetical protein
MGVWWFAWGALLLEVSLSTDVFTPGYREECPENEQYTSCSSSSCFEAVCSVAPTLFCTKDCKTGCQCIQGYARRGERCVPLSECTGTSAIIWKSASAAMGSEGVLRLQSKPERCVTTRALNEGERLTTQDCNKMTDLQLAFHGGVIHSNAKPELCLAANTTEMHAGASLVLAVCSQAANQKLHLDKNDGTIRSQDRALCLAHQPPLLLSPCSGANDQQWDLADNGCVPSQTAPLIDYGVDDFFRGWYDTEGCGFCRDFCRWVGRTSGGDPALKQLHDGSHWSCALAGSVREFTLPLYFTSWNYTKCSAQISDQERERSADAARDIALILEAELPTVPRSVPRKPRTIAPTEAAPTGSSNSSTPAAQNVTGVPPNVTKMSTQEQQVQMGDSTSPNTYAIPLGVVGGALVVAFLLLLYFCCRRSKETEAPLAKDVPKETVVAANILPASAPVQTPTRIVVVPIAPEDPPPPYHAINTGDTAR